MMRDLHHHCNHHHCNQSHSHSHSHSYYHRLFSLFMVAIGLGLVVRNVEMAFATTNTSSALRVGGGATLPPVVATHHPAGTAAAHPNNNINATTTTPSSNNNDWIPHNVSICFLGDSISRAAYISLAFFLKTGTWLDPAATKPGVANAPHDARTFAGNVKQRWLSYQKFTNQLLHPYEVCDCYRGQYDARYYYDEEKNNRLTFYMRGGHSEHSHPFRGRIAPQQLWQSSNFSKLAGLPFGQDEPATADSKVWEYTDWADVIRYNLGQWDQPPKHLVLNACLWSNRFDELEVRQSVLDAAAAIGVEHVYWRTCTAQLGVTDDNNATTAVVVMSHQHDHDAQMCDAVGQDHCIDIGHSLTAKVHADYFVDVRHFREPVNRLINEKTLDVLGYLPVNYQRLSVNVATTPYNEAVMKATLLQLLRQQQQQQQQQQQDMATTRATKE